MVTIKEIAKLAGVSPTTVSNVLHDRTNKVSPENIKRVKEVIASTHYVPNMGGRLLAKHGSRIIGVIMFFGHRNEQNPMKSPFYGEIFGALEAEIRKAGYFMLFYTVKTYKESMRVVSGWNIEGLIVLHCAPSEIAHFIDRVQVPVVFIDSYLYEDNDSFYNIGLDDFGGGARVGEFLQTQNLTRVAFLADEKKLLGVDLERFKGLQSVIPAKLISISHIEQKRHAFLQKEANRLARDFDVLFCASDFYAVDCMNVLQDMSVRIPQDLSIIGFDNNLLAAQSRPRLTTIAQDVSEKGTLAVTQLLARIHGEKSNALRLVLPIKLVIRESVRHRK
jgi:LacI family transcriptional regulator